MAKKHHSFTHTHIEHHKDGSATVHHVHHEGPHKDVKHAVPSLDHIHDSLQNHLGSPNPGEAEADAGQHGVPAEHAVPAGLPMPPPAGGAPGGMGV
jgi:hypothetical protein